MLKLKLQLVVQDLCTETEYLDGASCVISRISCNTLSSTGRSEYMAAEVEQPRASFTELSERLGVYPMVLLRLNNDATCIETQLKLNIDDIRA